MEQQPPAPPPPENSLFEMELDAGAQNRLNTISKWGKFIAITGLILVIVVVIALASQYEAVINKVGELMALDNKTVSIILVILAVIGGLCLIALYFLLRACILIRQGLLAQNIDRIAEGFKAMKVVFTISIIFSSLTILSSLFSMINS